LILILMRSRNPCPLGMVRVQRLCHLNGSLLTRSWVVPTTSAKGDSNEPLQKTITHYLALPIPYCVGSQVPPSYPDRACWPWSRELHKGLFPAKVVFSSTRTCSPGSDQTILL
jgi:hypothetical protein